MVDQWSLKVGDDIVLDQELHLFAGPTMGLSPLVELYPPHPITRGFTKRTLWPMVRSVEPDKTINPGLRRGRWRRPATLHRRDRSRRIFKHQKSKPSQRRKGPISVAVAVDANNKNANWARAKGGWWFTATPISPTISTSRKFSTRTSSSIRSIGWPARPRRSPFARARCAPRAVILTVSQFNDVFVASVLLLPELLLIMGIVVWRERRN